MAPDHAERVRQLFKQGLEVGPDQWRDLFARNCSDEALRREVVALLEADAEAEDFLEVAPVISREMVVAPAGLPATGSLPSEVSAGGQSMGPYRLLRVLGAGGMSTVYLGVRTDDAFRRRVAVKVLRQGFVSEDAVRRFQVERQILASLEHPFIARLYDGGTTETGIPYLAMEYVEGEPLNVHCDSQSLSLEERLELFRKVCSAVQYAHQNLVVHRDLKPNNIYVAQDGEPKLLDFGIAKLMNPELGALDLSPPTATWQRVLTPQYASPEQVRGGQMSTTSDVYSLGVVLFELLVGERPFDLRGLTPAAIERRLDEEAPPAPSSKVLSSAPGSELPCGLTSEQLRRRLRGDLDTILLKALRREPGRRYGSVEQFSEDVRRHLVGLPVRARRATAGYRLGKFVRRHRWPVAMAALFVAIVTSFVVVTVLQASNVARERDQARREAEKSERVLSLMTEVFQVADPRQAQGTPLTLEEALDRGAEVVAELEDQPEVRASLLSALVEIYRNSGLYSRAEELSRQALEASRSVHGVDSPQYGRNLGALAMVLRLRGEFEEAETVGKEALEIQTALLGGEAPEVAETMQGLVLSLAEGGKIQEARDLARRLRALQQRTAGPGTVEEFDSLQNLAGLEYMNGDAKAAVKIQRQVVSLGARVLGKEHPKTILALNNLAVFLETLGNLEEAEEVHRRCLALNREVLGNEHPDVALSLLNLAAVLIGREAYDEAEASLAEAVAIQRASLGPDHPDVASSLNNLGMLHLTRKNLQEAEVALGESLRIREQALGPDHPKVGVTLNNLAVVLFEQGKLAPAETLHRRALELRSEVLSPEHPNLALSRYNLARVLQAQDRLEEAEAGYRQALASFQASLGKRHRRVGSVLSSLATLLEMTDRPEESESMHRQAVEVLVEAVGAEHKDTRQALERLIQFYEARENPSAAAPYRLLLPL